MTYTTNETARKAVEEFQHFDADTQLGLLWFGYLDLKDQLTPNNATSAEVTAQALFDQIKAMSKEEQLQAQRDIASKANTDVSQTYSALGSSAKLELWLRLAQGMEKGTIIQVPDDYELPSETKDFSAKIKQLDFEERVNFMRSAVMEMGAKS
ncbi:orange carotenoid protein N-terminal domain-containing protein [Lyngbya aestuarii]|uniref:orange carotenoid protein N-terminal domain-containing protein n=1 Tax=Lyngbya aestuarii TaxID=118322 RepID=UPI00403DF0E4